MPSVAPTVAAGDLARLGAELDALLAEAQLLRRQLVAQIAVLRRRLTHHRLRRVGVSSAAQLDPAWGALARRLRAVREHLT